MRFFALLLMLVGIVAGAIYPWAVDNFFGEVLESYEALSEKGQFQEVIVPLKPENSPVQVRLTVDVINPLSETRKSAYIAVRYSAPEGPQQEDVFAYFSVKESDNSDGFLVRFMTDGLSPFKVDKPGDYRFNFFLPEHNELQFKSARLVIRANAWPIEPPIIAGGALAFLVGFILFVIATRRARNAPKPRPIWGRQ